MEGNMQEYLTEKKAREKRLAVYTEKIQETVLNKSAETIRLLVEERHNQKMTQQELSDITGIQPSNLARFESRYKSCLVKEDAYFLQTNRYIDMVRFCMPLWC